MDGPDLDALMYRLLVLGCPKALCVSGLRFMYIFHDPFRYGVYNQHLFEALLPYVCCQVMATVVLLVLWTTMLDLTEALSCFPNYIWCRAPVRMFGYSLYSTQCFMSFRHTHSTAYGNC